MRMKWINPSHAIPYHLRYRRPPSAQAIQTIGGHMSTIATLAAEARSALAGSFNGTLTGPDDAGYDEARSVYNAMIDRRPALVARCTSAADVAAVIGFARSQNALIAVRGGGHNGGGLGVVDDGVVIDLAGINGIDVDAAARTVRVGGGCVWKDVDAATHEVGGTVPCGIIGTTGVGGLTRGGGGNFGVVTAFTFKMQPVSMVVAGPTFWSLDDAAEVMRAYREFLPAAPRELNGWFAFVTVPPVPVFPEELHGRKMAAIVWCHTGSEDEAAAAMAPMLEAVEPVLHAAGPMPFPVLNGFFDALYPKGDQWYWRADFVRELPDAAIEQHVKFANEMRPGQSTMHMYPIDGAVHDVGSGDTAFSYRDVTWAQVIVGVDPDPANAEAIKRWTIDYWDATHPYSAGGAYVNFMMDEGQERVKATYRDNYDRLARAKAQYDPDNTFRVNQNIKPAS